MEALSALDLGHAEADLLRAAIDAKLAAYGVDVRNVAFTRVLLPDALTASLEARRLATIQLAEEKENYALEERRLNDRANLIALDQDSRRKALELESLAEALRFEKLEERLTAYPTAARYDLETQRLKVAQQLAGNSRAVVSLGGSDLVSELLTVQQAGGLGVATPDAASERAAGSGSAPRRRMPVQPRARRRRRGWRTRPGSGCRPAPQPGLICGTRAMLARR